MTCKLRSYYEPDERSTIRIRYSLCFLSSRRLRDLSQDIAFDDGLQTLHALFITANARDATWIQLGPAMALYEKETTNDFWSMGVLPSYYYAGCLTTISLDSFLR